VNRTMDQPATPSVVARIVAAVIGVVALAGFVDVAHLIVTSENPAANDWLVLVILLGMVSYAAVVLIGYSPLHEITRSVHLWRSDPPTEPTTPPNHVERERE
jgi:hypothetical protein